MLITCVIIVAFITFTGGLMVMDLQALHDLQFNDPCHNLTSINKTRIRERKAIDCETAFIGFENLHPVLKKRCPEAEDGRCRRSVRRNQWFCTVKIKIPAKREKGSLFGAGAMKINKTVELVRCIAHLDWDALRANPFTRKMIRPKSSRSKS